MLVPRLLGENWLSERKICKIPGRSSAISTEPSCKPGGESQIVPRLATLRSLMPAARRVTSDPLPQTSTQISVSDWGPFQGITPLLSQRNSVDRPHHPRSDEDSIRPAEPYFSHPLSTPIPE